MACTSLRAVIIARTLSAGSDLQWTDRTQPSRINWTIPSASFLSVLIGIALNASRTWRVSSNAKAKPVLAKPACSHCERGPASSPIPDSLTSSPENQAISASGALAKVALPARSIHRRRQHRCSTIPTRHQCRNDTPCSSLNNAWRKPVLTLVQHNHLEGCPNKPDIEPSPLRHLDPL